MATEDSEDGAAPLAQGEPQSDEPARDATAERWGCGRRGWRPRPRRVRAADVRAGEGPPCRRPMSSSRRALAPTQRPGCNASGRRRRRSRMLLPTPGAEQGGRRVPMALRVVGAADPPELARQHIIEVLDPGDRGPCSDRDGAVAQQLRSAVTAPDVERRASEPQLAQDGGSAPGKGEQSQGTVPEASVAADSARTGQAEQEASPTPSPASEKGNGAAPAKASATPSATETAATTTPSASSPPAQLGEATEESIFTVLSKRIRRVEMNLTQMAREIAELRDYHAAWAQAAERGLRETVAEFLGDARTALNLTVGLATRTCAEGRARGHAFTDRPRFSRRPTQRAAHGGAAPGGQPLPDQRLEQRRERRACSSCVSEQERSLRLQMALCVVLCAPALRRRPPRCGGGDRPRASVASVAALNGLRMPPTGSRRGRRTIAIRSVDAAAPALTAGSVPGRVLLRRRRPGREHRGVIGERSMSGFRWRGSTISVRHARQRGGARGCGVCGGCGDQRGEASVRRAAAVESPDCPALLCTPACI